MPFILGFVIGCFLGSLAMFALMTPRYHEETQRRKEYVKTRESGKEAQ